MLAAKSKMSNMFLHSGQEVDFIQQKDGFRLPETVEIGGY